MSFFFNGAQANVTLDSSDAAPFSVLSASQIAGYKSFYRIGAGVEVIYTVPANKRFFCYFFANDGNQAVGGAWLQRDAVNILVATTATNSPGISYSSPIPLAIFEAGEEVGFNGTTNAWLMMHGIEVDD